MILWARQRSGTQRTAPESPTNRSTIAISRTQLRQGFVGQAEFEFEEDGKRRYAHTPTPPPLRLRLRRAVPLW